MDSLPRGGPCGEGVAYREALKWPHLPTLTPTPRHKGPHKGRVRGGIEPFT